MFIKGKEENKQAMLDYLCKSIMEMRVNGSEEYNHICGLKLFKRETPEKTWCRYFPAGDYVRIIWSDDPERNDGYYDVYVDGDSAWGMFLDVTKRLKEIF